MMLTERDDRLIRTLLGKIRIISFDQIARAWWPQSDSGRTNAKRRVRDLLESKLLVREQAFARPLLALEKPLFKWKPGEGSPDYQKLSHQLQSRWVEEPRLTCVYLLSKRAANIFGGTAPGRIKNPSQVTHDLHLTEMFLRLVKEEPKLAEAWAGEDIVAPTREHQKLPDAIILDVQGKPRLVMEFGGAYPPHRVQAFHEDCQARGLPYEMW
jgi:hypothetical protein